MGVGTGLSMYVVVVQKFTFAISSPDEFLFFMQNTQQKHKLLHHCLCNSASQWNQFSKSFGSGSQWIHCIMKPTMYTESMHLWSLNFHFHFLRSIDLQPHSRNLRHWPLVQWPQGVHLIENWSFQVQLFKPNSYLRNCTLHHVVLKPVYFTLNK